MSKKIDYVDLKSKVLEASSGGLYIIAKLYSDFDPNKPKNQFKIRDNEKTPSASAYQIKGVWGVRDFGNPVNGDKWIAAIDLWMEFHRLEFTEALQDLAAVFTVVTEAGEYIAKKPEYKRLKIEKAKEVNYELEFKESMETIDIEPFNKRTTTNENLRGKFAEVLDQFGFRALKSYTLYSEDLSGHHWIATQGYPILVSARGADGWKIYKPYEIDPRWRFQWLGKKPKDWYFGMEQLIDLFDERKSAFQEELMLESPKDYVKQLEMFRLNEVVIASGESDAINFWAYTDTPAICLDSETAKITPFLLNELRKYARKIYLCYDIDATGIEKAYEICMEHVDIHWIKLPNELRQKKDWRLKPCKDFKNWCEHYDAYEFRTRLLPVAYPMRFWDYQTGRSVGYVFNPVYCVHHLSHQNYFRYVKSSQKNGFTLIKKTGHVLSEINQRENDELKNYLLQFAYQKRLNADIMNMILRTKQVTESVMKALPYFTESLERATRDRQYWFYQNAAWEISKDGIKSYEPGSLNRYVFDDLIINIPGHDEAAVEMQSPYLEFYKDETGRPRVKFLRNDHSFLQYFINIARIHWKDEFKAFNDDRDESEKVSWYETNEVLAKKGLNTLSGASLEQWQRDEQEQAFINLACIMGYMLHTKFDSALAVACWISDNEERDVSDSKGGTGKSILGRALKYFNNTVSFEARKSDIWDDKHMFQNVDENTDMCWFDDAQIGFPFDKIYTAINGFMVIRPQYGKHYELKGDQLPKFFITSNFYPKNILHDDSTRRRIWFGTSSDFYHAKGVEFERKKDPQFDLGMRLFDDWGVDEWCGFYRLMADMVIGYFTIGQTEPPMRSATKQMARQQMGPVFHPWADNFMHDKIKLIAKPEDLAGHKIDNAFKIPSSLVLAAFLQENRAGINRREAWTSGYLKKCVEAWCTYHGYTFNPQMVKNASGRVQVKINAELATKWNDIATSIGLTERDWSIKEREVVECFYIIGIGQQEEVYQAPQQHELF